jgi:hypothetical protein
VSNAVELAGRARRLNWSGARHDMMDHYLRQDEIPLEYLVSLPAPTRRYGKPAFAFFACAALRKPGAPTLCMPPDRTWAIAATSAKLVYYAWEPERLGPDASRLALEPPDGDAEAVIRRLDGLDPIMDRVSAAFFEGEAVRSGRDIAEEFLLAAGRPLAPFYRAIAADFFEWLEGADGR